MAVLFMRAENCIQPKCPSVGAWVNKTHSNRDECQKILCSLKVAIRNNEYIPYNSIYVKLEERLIQFTVRENKSVVS